MGIFQPAMLVYRLNYGEKDDFIGPRLTAAQLCFVVFKNGGRFMEVSHPPQSRWRLHMSQFLEVFFGGVLVS